MKGKFYDGIWEAKLHSKAKADFRGKLTNMWLERYTHCGEIWEEGKMGLSFILGFKVTKFNINT